MAEPKPDSGLGDLAGSREARFFEGMRWPVPLCFAGAISGMRFEQGDVLYRDRRAYDALSGKMPEGLQAIQVLRPLRSTRAMASDSEGTRRSVNWRSEVTIELLDLSLGRAEIRTLSQGKLAMALFEGDDSWLDPEREEPSLPWSAKDLQQRLAQTPASFAALSKTKRGSRFIFVVDLASDASRSKAAGVEEALRTAGPVDRRDLFPSAAGVEESERFHPALVIRALECSKRSVEDVLPILRTRLYGGVTAEPDRDAKAASNSETKAAPDRFSIGRHGILEALGA